MIYLDNAATTQIDESVLKLMQTYSNENYANPSSIYDISRFAKQKIHKAREQVSKILNCQPYNIIFTSGGSESNNSVVHSVIIQLLHSRKTDIIISSGEHDSVLESSMFANQVGLNVKIAPLNKDGTININELEDMIDDNTGFISVMYVNNEIGSINDVEKIGTICMKNDILFHTDCVQAAGYHPIDVQKIGCDFASISSHKIHGPKGVGALYIKNPETYTPLIYGGQSQEFGLRGGTENVTGIIGFGQACENVYYSQKHCNNIAFVSMLKQIMYSELSSKLGDRIVLNGQSIVTPGRILNIQIKDFDAETLILMLESHGIYVSAGSACRSRSVEPSRVLKSIGLSDEEARSSIRISFSNLNTIDEVKYVAKIFERLVNQ